MNKVRANRVLVPFIRRWLKINRLTSSVLRVMLDAEKSRIKEQGKKALTDGNALGENEEEKSGNTDRPKFALCASMRSSTCRISTPRAGAERLTTR